jgi:hypothetical protein
MVEKVAFVVPGYSFSTELERYQRIGDSFRKNDFDVEYIDLDWSKVLDENIDEVKNEIRKRLEKYSEPEIFLFGHSWGAVCCLAASPELNPESQILAGLSPEFREELKLSDLTHRKFRYMLERILRKILRIPGFSRDPPSLEEISREDIGKVYLLYGQKEYNSWRTVIWGLNSKITERRTEILDQSEEIIVPNSGHLMKSEEYLSKIEEVIQDL